MDNPTRTVVAVRGMAKEIAMLEVLVVAAFCWMIFEIGRGSVK